MLLFKDREKERAYPLWERRSARRLLEGGGCALTGFCLSAASLGNGFLPLSMGFICGCPGALSLWAAAGSALGYGLFWGGTQPIAWCASALLLSALLGEKRLCRRSPLLLPLAAALTVALWGVLFQAFSGDRTPVALYLLRILLATVTCGVFFRVLREREPLFDWLAWGLGTLGLAQLAPLPYLGLGYVAAGALLIRGAFPAAALAGLALDLAGITGLPMTAILSLAYLSRFLPKPPAWFGSFFAVCTCGIVMYICGIWDLTPVPGLLLGTMLGAYLPAQKVPAHRRGEVGLAQVRLEMAAGALAQTEQLLAQIPEKPIDTQLLLRRGTEAACGSCPCRKGCPDAERAAAFPESLLQAPLESPEEIPVVCKKSSRMLAHLQQSRQQYRAILADRERQREWRTAVQQQYGFLSDYLQTLSDSLIHRPDCVEMVCRVEVRAYGNRPAAGNGDRCLRFPGTGGKYYVLLCDGMGSGPAAAQEAKTGGVLLQRLLQAGYPAEHALGCLNSICALRDRAGILTVDMAEIRLDTGNVSLYKWGAAPSYLITAGTAEKIGVSTPPPGLSAFGNQVPVRRLRPERGALLLMVSDGVEEEAVMQICKEGADIPDERLARCLLEQSAAGRDDDATVVCVRLREE